MASVNPASEQLSILLSCYLDGALGPGELDEVVAALETDLSAVAEFRRLKESRRAVRLLPLLDVPLYLQPDGHLSEELSAFLDGQLVTTEVPIVTGHLASCDDCRYELAELDRSRTAIRALPGLEPPVFLSIEREKKTKSKTLRTTVFIASGVAAVTLAFALAPFSSSTEPASVTITDLDARHAAVASVPAVQVGSP
ncbi:MAG: hypothetical protein GWP18_06460 [Proteobacteria bacterium]|nr:hypothetical protein [Pseudomonadota bacterium]